MAAQASLKTQGIKLDIEYTFEGRREYATIIVEFDGRRIPVWTKLQPSVREMDLEDLILSAKNVAKWMPKNDAAG